jgi:hypothetical protein
MCCPRSSNSPSRCLCNNSLRFHCPLSTSCSRCSSSSSSGKCSNSMPRLKSSIRRCFRPNSCSPQPSRLPTAYSASLMRKQCLPRVFSSSPHSYILKISTSTSLCLALQTQMELAMETQMETGCRSSCSSRWCKGRSLHSLTFCPR